MEAKSKKKFSLKSVFWGKKSKIFYGIAILLGASMFATSLLPQKPKVYISHSQISDSHITNDKVTPARLYIYFDENVASIDTANKPVDDKVQISPQIRGQWGFSGDRNLIFIPEKDWMPDTEYKITFAEDMFTDTYDVPLSYTFSSPQFKTKALSYDFYEDPIDFHKKHAVASFLFSFPINKDTLQDDIYVATIDGEKLGFTYEIDKDRPNLVHIISEPLRIKKNEDFVIIRVDNVKNAYNNQKPTSSREVSIKIPDQETFFKVIGADSQIIENEENQLEQILFVNFSSSVDAQKLLENIEFYASPKYCYNLENASTEYRKLDKIDMEVVSHSFAKSHSFKYDTQKAKCIIVRVKEGLLSNSGFALASDKIIKASVANYPMTAEIMFDGALLSLSGDKKLPLSSRGAKFIETKVGRINSTDINHLISQSYGDFENPAFNSYFDEYNLIEEFADMRPIAIKHPRDLNYSSVDLNKYFKEKKGIFFVKVRPCKDNKKYPSCESENRRLVVVTDMGIIIKRNTDSTIDVYVSSFADNEPVAGASIEVLGQNGIPVLSGKTNANGKISFPSLNDFEKSQRPVAIVAKKDGDVSFISLNRYDRKIEYSRFDVGGESYNSHANFYAYTFSDRGIYRPSETAHFGITVRTKDLNVPKSFTAIAKIYNSKGSEVLHKTVKLDEFGIADLNFNIPANAPVGEYSLNLYYPVKNSHIFLTSQSFQVQEFTPDTLRASVAFENAPVIGWYVEKEVKATITVENLYGGPAIGNKVSANVRIVPTDFYFEQYKEYNFDNPILGNDLYRAVNSPSLVTKQTNRSGVAEYDIDLSQYRGSYKLNLAAEAFEKDSGRAVFANKQMMFASVKHLLGYKSDGELYNMNKDTVRKLNFIVIDNELSQQEMKDLTFETYHINYVKTLVKLDNGTFKYQMMPVDKLLKTSIVNIAKQGHEMVLDTGVAGKYYVLVKNKSGDILTHAKYSIKGEQNINFTQDTDANLYVSLNKKQYKNGENIVLDINSPYVGYGLVTIEKDKVYAQKWFKTDKKSTSVSIKLPDDISGNAYINVAFIRDQDSKEIFMPPLSYSVTPFEISKEKQTMDLQVYTSPKVKSGQDLIVKYSSKQKGKVILYGVNKGILQVSNYKTPNLISEYYPKKRLGVDTFQILDLILPEMNVLLNQLATGGSDYDEAQEGLSLVNPFARKQSKAVAFWSGVLDISDVEGTYKYKVPSDYNGEIQVMAISVSEGKYGRFQANVKARNDFASTTNGPFNVSPHDKFVAGLSLTNFVEGAKSDYPIKLSVNTSEGLELQGTARQSFTLGENDQKSFQFEFKALEVLGPQTITYTIEAENDPSKKTIVLFEMGIRPTTPYTTKLITGHADGSVELKDFLDPMYKEYYKQKVSASYSPLVLATGLISYLQEYTHRCTEQIISRTYPMIELLFNQPELVKDIDVREMFNDTLSRITSRQRYDGGIGLWTNGSSNPYASLYAYDFLTRAGEYGFYVSDIVKNNLKSYVKTIASGDTPDENVAYAIYLLTREGEVTSNYILNLRKSIDTEGTTSPLTKVYLAGAYALLHNEKEALNMISEYKISNNLKENSVFALITSLHFKEIFDDEKAKLANKIYLGIADNKFTTNSGAAAILALVAYPKDTGEIEFVGHKSALQPFPNISLPRDAKVLQIKDKGGKEFYYSSVQQGYINTPTTKAVSNGIELAKNYYDKEGKEITSVPIGHEVEVVIHARTKGVDYIHDVAITDILPGGLEMIRDTITADKSLDYSEAREDRALIYLTLTEELTIIRFKAKAIAKGEFVAPATVAESLYNPDRFANTKASSFVVGK